MTVSVSRMASDIVGGPAMQQMSRSGASAASFSIALLIGPTAPSQVWLDWRIADMVAGSRKLSNWPSSGDREFILERRADEGRGVSLLLRLVARRPGRQHDVDGLAGNEAEAGGLVQMKGGGALRDRLSRAQDRGVNRHATLLFGGVRPLTRLSQLAADSKAKLLI